MSITEEEIKAVIDKAVVDMKLRMAKVIIRALAPEREPMELVCVQKVAQIMSINDFVNYGDTLSNITVTPNH
eukprot:Awhi_evm2s4119